MPDPREVFAEFYDSEDAQSYYVEHDSKRDRETSEELQPLIDEFLEERIDVEEFKSRVDGINKPNSAWGFNGFNGQMHFNQLMLSASDRDAFGAEIRQAITLPDHLQEARDKIDDQADLAREHRDNNLDSEPAIKPTMFFLSYFWHIQAYEEWPIFYPITEQYLQDNNLFEDGHSYGETYTNFVQTLDDLREIAAEVREEPVVYRDVSNAIYWYRERLGEEEDSELEEPVTITTPSASSNLFLPPVVADLVEVAENSDEAQEKYDANDSALANIFEDKLGHTFRMLGFDTEELGQGSGREPDGIAIAVRNNYAVIYDAKMRQNGYSIGRDDRAIREYIEKHTRKLRDQGQQNIYFTIISSDFPDPDESVLQDLVTNTDIDNIVLLRAEILEDMIKMRLKEPYLNLDDLQAVFGNRSGLIHREELQNIVPEWREVTLNELL